MIKTHVYAVLAIIVLVAVCITPANTACVECVVEVEEETILDDKTLLMAIEAQMEKADAEIAEQNWETANQILQKALAELGRRYYRSDIIDDSGMRIIATDLLEKEGKLGDAARGRRETLAVRLERFRSKIQQPDLEESPYE